MPFVGRQDEMNRINRLWADVRSGRGPRVAVLISDSGYGKTELIKEFYRQIAAAQETRLPSAYWPPDLNPATSNTRSAPLSSTSLRTVINPPLPDVVPTASAIPWMWWAIDWPDCRGASGLELPPEYTLPQYLQLLQAHLRFVDQAKATKLLARQTALKWLKTFCGFLPYIGPIVTPLFTVVDMTQEAHPLSKALTRALPSAADAHATSLEEACIEALRLVSSLLDCAETDAPTIPFVLVLENCQWGDHYTLEFVATLLDRAIASDWPLFILASHHEREWERSATPRDCMKGRITKLRDALAKIPEVEKQARIHELRLGKLSECTCLLNLYLPTIGDAASRLITERADGNPLYLLEFVRVIKSEQERRSRYFVDSDPTRPLSEYGLAELTRRASRFDDVVRMRLDQVFAESPATIHTLKVAAVQGCSFYEHLVVKVAERLACICVPEHDAEGLDSTLDRACTPYGIITPPTLMKSEFRHRSYFQQLRDWPSESERAAFEEAFAQTLIAEIKASNPNSLQRDATTIELYRFAVAQLLRLYTGDIPRDAEVAMCRAFAAVVSHDSDRMSGVVGQTIIDLLLATSLTAAQARILFSAVQCFCEGNFLLLDKLAHVDVGVATEIALLAKRCDGPFGLSVSLNNVTELSAAALIQLSPVYSLSLNGLAEFPPNLLAVMENCGGLELSLGGLQHISVDTAFAIRRIKVETVFFSAVTAITPAAMAALGGIGDDPEPPFGDPDGPHPFRDPDAPWGIYVFDSLDIHDEPLAAAIVDLEQRGYKVYYRSCACSALPPRNDYWEKFSIDLDAGGD